ncbi:MFS transporter [Actinomadura rayongensis]|uniref:MFS transporter n=1 Tax=Actinomadura rayongensis TaxID=1429076 RepID=A0A6I4W582_9ACTN|nr:MFS transporter [Actinomadura rayongensis]MXQ63910.1 MFS transporter [Actinomadura rayongensis]
MTTTAPRRAAPRPAAVAPFGRTAAVLAATALLATSQLYGAIPLLGAAADDWGTRPGPLTWLVTAFGLGYAAGFLLFGPLSDRLGRRRVMVAGVAATAVTTALVALAPGLAAALVLRVLQGVTIGAFPPVAMAYVGERVAPHRRLLTVTAMTTGFLSSAVVGQLTAQGMLALLGWRSFFGLGAVLFAVAALALRALLLPDVPRPGVSPAAAYRAMPRLLAAPGLRTLYLAVPVVLGSFVAIYTGLQLTGTDGLLGLRASALPVILAIPFATPRLARLDPVARTAAALVLAAAGTALIGLLAPGTTLLALLLMAVTAGIGVTAPGMIDLIGSRAGAHRAPAISLFTALMFVGASAGPQLAAALAGRGLTLIAFALAALLAVAAGLVRAARRGLNGA